MKMRKDLIALAVVVCMMVSCSKESTVTTNVVENENAIELERELLETVNAHRAAIGKNTLQLNSVAYEYANAHTDYMIAKGAINHDNFSKRASAISAGTQAELVAENVAKDYATSAQAFEGWHNSARHKTTMEGEFTHTAVSVKRDAEGSLYFTQIFYR